MLGNRFNQAKCETTSRLCVGRIKLLRNKKTVQLKQSQKDIADLLRSGKQEYARIRVEGVIREKYLMQAYEILELYLELLTVRVQLLTKTKELPRDMMEAVSSIIYAAQRISDLPELSTLRALFASKYGKEYAAEAAADATASRWQVNANLIRCLLVEAPQPEEKLEMLSEIAQSYGVEWDLSAAARDMGVGAAGPSGQLPHGINSDQGPAATAAAAAATAAAMAAADWPPANRYPAMGATPVPAASAPAPVLGFNHMQYANAQQAAAAAAHAAAQANAAAQYAAHVAALAHQGAAVVANGAASAQMVVAGAAPLPTPAAAVARSSPSPPPAQLPQVPHDNDASESAPFPPLGPGPAASSSSSGGGGGTASVVSSAGGYFVRSDSDIQRAYDAAQGPPTKGAFVTAPPAPLPPPPPPPQPVPAPAAAPPSPPLEKGQASAPPAPQTAEDEYEELTRRLEALKKS